MLFLILSDGHLVGFLYEDVHGHKCGVGEQSGVDALVGVGSDYLLLYVLRVVGDAELLAGFVLERRCAHQLSDTYMHVEQQVHLGYFRYVALHEYGGFVGVDARCKIFGEDIVYVLVKGLGVGIGGKCVKVSYEVEAVIVILHLYELVEGSVVVAQVQIARGTDAREHDFFIFHIGMVGLFGEQSYKKYSKAPKLIFR